MDNNLKTRSPDEIKTDQNTDQEVKTPIEPPAATILISPPIGQLTPPPPPVPLTPSSPSQPPPSQLTRQPSNIDRANNMLRRTGSMINKPKFALRAGELAAKKIVGLLGQMTIQSLLPIFIPIVIMLIVLLLMLSGFLIMPGGSGTTGSSTTSSIGGSSPLSTGSLSRSDGGASLVSTNLYNRGGKLVKIGNPELAKIVNEIAIKVGVPDILVMAILTRESEELVTNTSTTCRLETDYCPTTSSAGAIGAMQIIPSTFAGVFRSYASELRTNFEKTDKSLDISLHTFQEKDPVLRIASIRDSITAGAYELRRLKERINAPWNENTIRTVAAKYHGGEAASLAIGCSLNYCDDVWKSIKDYIPTSLIVGNNLLYQLINSLNAVCGDGVKSGNVTGCLNNIPSTLNNLESVKKIIKASANLASEFVLQCVGFVEAAIKLLDYPPLIAKGRADAYADHPYPANYTFHARGTSTIQIGDIPIWSGGNWGHIALIVEVHDNKNFKVAEANYCFGGTYPCGKIGLRDESLDNTKLKGWLRKQ